MWSLLENYEQQYAIINADITSKIGKLKLLDQNDNGRRNIIIEIDKQLEEVNELMEQMDLEIREVDPSTRPKYKTRIDSYRAELERLSQEYSKAKANKNHSEYHVEYFSEGSSNINEEQKQRLLDTSEDIERTGKHLETGYRIALETEKIAADVLNDLEAQRETIQRTRNRLRETNEDLSRSSRIISLIISRSMHHRLILMGVGVTFVLVFMFGIYHAFA
ncbi:hypothetical protein WDU94_003867 [Cyamophila willieti]